MQGLHLPADRPNRARHRRGLQRSGVLRPDHAVLPSLATSNGKRYLLHRDLPGLRGVQPLPRHRRRAGLEKDGVPVRSRGRDRRRHALLHGGTQPGHASDGPGLHRAPRRRAVRVAPLGAAAGGGRDGCGGQGLVPGDEWDEGGGGSGGYERVRERRKSDSGGGRKRRGRRSRDRRAASENDGVGDDFNVFDPPGGAAGAEDGAGGNVGCESADGIDGDGVVAPYSSALQAVGAAAGDPNGSGWGWKNDLCQALRMISSNRIVLVLFAASSARMIATWAMAGYMATYYHREFPSQVSLYSVLNAVAVSIGGMASSYGGGAISDRLRVRNEGVLGYLPALGSVLAILPVAVALFSTNFYLSITALFVTYLVGECWLGPGMACLQMELPKEIAGTSVAILLFLNSVICNVGTWFIGVMDGGVNGGLATIRKPFFAVLFMSYFSSFLLFGLLGLMVSNKHRRRLDVDVTALQEFGINGNGDADKGYPGGDGGGTG
ncbi:unnamed protein product, partial [Scytosiphon promiscuus]